MSGFEVSTPILNSPYDEPAEHWRIVEGEPAVRVPGRRIASYWYRPPGADPTEHDDLGTHIELILVNRIRERVKAWRSQGYPGVSRTTLELLQYWRRDGREQRLFFAQLEAAETIVFLVEARPDFKQGVDIPIDEPSDERKSDGFRAFTRYACKMATGSGKTTVMGMLAAWSILNKVHTRSDARFSDVALVVCPNVTIRNRLSEIDPARDEASLYRTRDLVPQHLMTDLRQGRVLVTNWHVFEPQQVQTGGSSARVVRAGREEIKRERITIGPKTTTARGSRYLSLDDYQRQVAAGLLNVFGEERDKQGNLVRVEVESRRYVESDSALLNRVLGREVGGKQNILVFNDEAHHAYRIRRPEPEEGEEDLVGEDDIEAFFREATVWVDGLDRIHKLRGINFCVDMSATPYFLGRMGPLTNRPFFWVVSEFGLTDAIESGLVKIPQLAVRDTTGAEIPGYFNIWRWILPRLTTTERGGRKASVKPEAVLKWAHAPIAMLGGLWDEVRREWELSKEDPRPPVFILVCKNTKIAKVAYEWLAEDKPPVGVPSARIEGFRNTDGRVNTIRVDSKVVAETDTGEPKNDESRWMRLTLDTVGQVDWRRDREGRSLMPAGFEELASKLGRPMHPPGREVRCIVSVGMLTEGWDCQTVTHIIGLRPFMSQLLCEQVVGRGLRRRRYDVGEDGKLTEEVAKILGVPFHVIPFKENRDGAQPPPPKRHHVHAVPEKAQFELRFPRVEGYRQAVRNRVRVDWDAVAPLTIDSDTTPLEVEMKAGLLTNQGRPSLHSPGVLVRESMEAWRNQQRLQRLTFEMARELTKLYVESSTCHVPAHVLFPQIRAIVCRYLADKVDLVEPATLLEAGLSPYYGWILEQLLQAIRPDELEGETPELPIYETNRGPGSTGEVDFWTSREVREVVRSHLNYVVADTKKWEQSAASMLDNHPSVAAFAKNAGLGLSIPYLQNGESHDYVPDFLIRLAASTERYCVLETKGFDPLADVKHAAAQRWVNAINADGRHGTWSFVMVREVVAVRTALDSLA